MAARFAEESQSLVDASPSPPGARPPAASATEMVQIVFPSDTNPRGTIFGGRVVQWVDQVAAIAAQRHCRQVVVTVSMDALEFIAPLHLGEYAVLQAVVNRSWRSSMEIGVRVEAEAPLSGERRLCAEAFLTFVAVDAANRPVPVPQLAPETPAEQARYAAAEARRQARLARRQAPSG